MVAAGNDNRDLETSQFWPCEAPAANVLCVGASDLTDARIDASNYGPQAVDVFAPGLNVMTTSPLSAYASGRGHLDGRAERGRGGGTGAVRRLRQPAGLRALLLDHADRKPALTGLAVSGGRVNALAVLEALRPDTDDDGVANAGDLSPSRFALPANGCPAEDQDGDEVNVPGDNCPRASQPRPGRQ